MVLYPEKWNNKKETSMHLKCKVLNGDLKQKLFMFYFQNVKKKKKKRNSHGRDFGEIYERPSWSPLVKNT